MCLVLLQQPCVLPSVILVRKLWLFYRTANLIVTLDDRVRAISLAMGMTPIMWTSTATPGGIKMDTNGTLAFGSPHWFGSLRILQIGVLLLAK